MVYIYRKFYAILFIYLQYYYWKYSYCLQTVSRGNFVKSSYIRLFIFVFLLVSLIIPKNVLADENIDISIEYGIDGKIQIGKGFPLTIKLTNEDEDFTGDLVIFSNPNYAAIGNIVVPVNLQKGKEKMIKVAVPGYDDSGFYSQQPQNNQQSFIRLFEGDWEEGKEVKLGGNKKFKPSYFPEGRLVLGVLSDSPDALIFLKLSKYNTEPIEFLSIKEDDLPDDSTGFGIFDVILINDYNLSNVSTKRQQALKDWVKSGGHLMIGSNPSLSQQLGEVSELSLLNVNSQSSFDELHFISKNKGDANPPFESIEIMTGDIADNTIVHYDDHSLPMVMGKSFGLGKVTQFAFNVGNDTLSSWDPYASWWQDVLRKTVDKDNYGQQRFEMEELSRQLGNIVDAYPSSFLPLTVLIILFIVYLIILIPGLYFILKKLDKRESSWWIIPAVAIISSISIFLVGAKDRLAGSQINDVSILAVDDTGEASGYGAVSILTNSGGDYSLKVQPGEFKPFPLGRDNFNYDDMQLDYAMVERGQKQTKITFNDVEYWSIRSALGDIQSKDVGKLDSNLKVENNKLVGSITSLLSFDLEEAFLLTGNEAFSLGRIEAGSTGNISIELDNKKAKNMVSAPRSTIANKVIPGVYNASYMGDEGPADKESLNQWKKYELLNTVMTHEIYQRDLNQPLIAGFTSDSLINTKVDKKQANSNSLTLITQAAKVMPSLEGEFSLTGRAFQPDLSIYEGSEASIHHNGILEGGNFVAVEIGKYLLTYQLPGQMKTDNVNIKKLKLKLSRGNGTSFYILNAKTDEFISMDDSSAVTFEENANDFLSEDGSIVIMFEKSGLNNPEVPVPAISIEGEYKK